jgi:hypothetical protein
MRKAVLSSGELLEHDEEGHRQVGGEIDTRIRGNAIHPGEAKAA